MKEDPNYVETHDSRMIRKFGSKEQFELVKRSHGLIPRGAEVGLDASCGYTEENLSKRLQSSTLRSQRLVYFVAKRYGWEKCEELYGVLNRRHFIESGVLNDIGLLLDSCDEVGLNREMCENFLISNEYEKEVLQLYGELRLFLISAIVILKSLPI